jgi:hypothetical protein
VKLSKLNELPSTREMIDAFKGYNHNIRIGEGEFYDMKNLTSDEYPSLSPRKKRGIYESPENPLGLISKDALCYVDGRNLYIDKYKVEGLELDPTTKKTLISMGAYIIIMPDKKYINTEKLSDYGSVEAEVETKASVTFSLCKVDGTEYENTKVQDTAPEITEEMLEDPSSLPLWIDTSQIPHQLKQYSTTSAMWSGIATTYIKISSMDNIGLPFSENDGVTISGVEDEALADLNASAIIWAKGDNYIVVTGILDKVTTQSAPITIARKMPNMDFIIESENRLWGCRYGVALNGEVVNEIYACKLGDFKNWNCFAGISTDSYVASLGTDGQFTGAITYLGYPLFFKEDCIHKVYGNYPANFQIQTTPCRGVQKGSSKSLALVNETLFYKSRYAICAYDGSLPVEMSSAMGNKQYSDAVAGAHGNKYYVSMRDEEDYHLFVYDTFKRMWHKEDNTQAAMFCNSRGNLYYIDYDTKQIMSIEAPLNASEGEIESKIIKWSAETGIIGTDSPYKKYISRLIVRLSLELGAKVTLFADYDSLGIWEPIYSMDGNTLKTVSIPIKTRRCDHVRLRIEGEGDVKIFSICKTIEQGSDL